MLPNYTSKYSNHNSNNNSQSTNKILKEEKNPFGQIEMDRIKNESYVGCRGYTILRTSLNPSQFTSVKKNLTIRPRVMGAPVQANISYPVYRECTDKIYVPRYYGFKKFGYPETYKFQEVESINVPFDGSLRECQEEAVDAYINHVNLETGGCGLIEKGCGKGKTVDGLYICSKLKKKTLIIVHKEFLMDQWIERIHQYLPTARIGKLQGDVIDVQDKDIVIGMLQSISMKNYHPSIFAQFGLTIVDEVHHISSDVFSRALFKICTKFMLGLSATMERKDGTTDVIKMFLGDVVYTNLDQGDHPVVVKSIRYECNDTDFQEVVYDFRGNVQFSTMITKLCSYNPRSEFALDVIVDIKEKFGKKQQMLILAHNKNLLEYIHTALIERRGMGAENVGYYVGGMKRVDLEISSKKQFIIATYAMAAEALDIPSLNTLIMLTPKTDIQQAVGRILRIRHENPIIVDIVDCHEVLKRQWLKRRQFYRTQNYRIMESKSSNYMAGGREWNFSDPFITGAASVSASNTKTTSSSKLLANSISNNSKAQAMQAMFSNVPNTNNTVKAVEYPPSPPSVCLFTKTLKNQMKTY